MVPEFISLGVVVKCVKVDAWQQYEWHASHVLLDAGIANKRLPPKNAKGESQYHIATLPLDLHPTDTTSYLVNLTNGTPSVYVMMQDCEGAGREWPIYVEKITVSTFEAQAYDEAGIGRVERVPMPLPLVMAVSEFVAQHHPKDDFSLHALNIQMPKAAEPESAPEAGMDLYPPRRLVGGRY